MEWIDKDKKYKHISCTLDGKWHCDNPEVRFIGMMGCTSGQASDLLNLVFNIRLNNGDSKSFICEPNETGGWEKEAIDDIILQADNYLESLFKTNTSI
jgi:hypothetical protein